MDERGDQAFEVAPTRIGGSHGPGRPGRRRRAPILLVILLATAIPTIAWIGPRIEWRPEVDLSFLRPTPAVPTPTPRPTRAPTSTQATPLPKITVGVGPHPTEPFPVDVGGMRLADPTTGSLGPPLGLRVETDAVFTSADGGWWCVCIDRLPGTDRETASAEIRRVDPSGRVTFRQTIGEYESAARPPFQDFYVRFDLEVSPDQRTAYLSSATRTDERWTLVVEAIDLATGSVAGRTELDRLVIPAIVGPTPPPDQGTTEHYLGGPYLRLSPDGRRLLVWASMETYSGSGEQLAPEPRGWLIDIDPKAADGSVGTLSPVMESIANRLRTCYWTAWTTEAELASICTPSDPSRSTVSLELFSPEGDTIEGIELASSMNAWLADPVLDRANRRVFVWWPGEHNLQRVDLDRRLIEELKVDPTATEGRAPGTGSGPGQVGSGARPDWSSFGSDMRLYYGPQLLPERGGGRLFALGWLDEGNSRRTFMRDGTVLHRRAPSGIWVFDAGKLSLLDHWGALASYGSIGLSSDGRWLLAAGLPGSDDDGNQVNWEASITVHDVADGRPALQLGSLGTDAQVLQVPP